MSCERARRVALALVTAATLVTLAACIVGESAAREDAFQVGAAPVLVVENSNGEVRVATGQPGSIEVVTTIRFADNMDYSARQSGDTITVKAETISVLRSDARADIAVTVPPETSVTIATGNGLISIEGLRSSGTARTGNGDIGLKDFEGVIQAVAGNGRISVIRGVGSFDLSSGNGDIVLKGRLSAGTASSLNTGNGSVTVEFDGSPSVVIDAETGRGRVTSDHEMSATTLSEPKHLTGRIGGGVAELRMASGNGDITIR